MLGGAERDPRTVATAVSTTLFGSRGAPDDSGAEEAYFLGAEQVDYYDGRNSFVDSVLERRVGIPITLSLIYGEVCARLGLPFVGINAPGHLLCAPADASAAFVVDPFDRGAILDLDAAAGVVATNAGMSFDVQLGGVQVEEPH